MKSIFKTRNVTGIRVHDISCYCLMVNLCLFVVFIFLFGCKRMIDINVPSTSVSSASVFSSDATAIAAVTALYSNISASNPSNPQNISGLSSFCGLSSDEFALYRSVNTTLTQIAYYHNALSGTNNGYGSEFWGSAYSNIYVCNAALEELDNTNSLTPLIKQQLLGEVKFMRAFFYFYLTNLFGDVPIAISSNYKVNNILGRVPAVQVYQQIVADLKDAQSLLSTSYLDGTLLNLTSDRIRPNRWIATALLARVYLYTRAYDSAEIQSSAIIDNSSLFSLSTLNDAFLRASLGNNEAIWQLQPVNAGSNTEDAKGFIVPSTGPGTGFNIGIYLSRFLLNSFENGDNRRSSWVDSIVVLGNVYYFPYKYKVNTLNVTISEHTTMLRLAEQFLIRAEARAQQGNILGAQSDLNLIRSRAGLLNITDSTRSKLLAAILHERQVELFTELGQRWLDLKRTGNVDEVMGNRGVCAAKGGVWMSNQQLYPLAYYDLQIDPHLVQNLGY